MLGLPTETREDQEAIAELANKIAVKYYEIPKERRNGKCQITISTSFFVPKPFTPFQWAKMYSKEHYLSCAKTVNDAVKNQLNHKSMKYNWHEADVTVLEGILARGDRRLGQVIKAAYEKGCIFDAWSDFFDNEKWIEAFLETGIDPDFYTLRERPLDEILPWDFIDAGVTKEFLKREYENALKETVTLNCREKCSGCGAARFGGGVCLSVWQEILSGKNLPRPCICAKGQGKTKPVFSLILSVHLRCGLYCVCASCFFPGPGELRSNQKTSSCLILPVRWKNAGCPAGFLWWDGN